MRYLPECPRMLRNAGDQPLVAWITIQHGADSRTGSVNILNLKTLENTPHELPGRPGFFVESVDPGVLLIGVERRLIFYDVNRHEITETGVEIPAPERVIINDGTAVESGIVFGSKDFDFAQEIAALYYFIQPERLCILRERQICSNGKMLLSRGNTTTWWTSIRRAKTWAHDANLDGWPACQRVIADYRQVRRCAGRDGPTPMAERGRRVL